MCSDGCYLYVPFLYALTWIGNISLPVFTILLTNILLITRTLKQKNKMQQIRVWSKNRNIVLQLVT